MIRLYDGGVYLVNGNEIIPEGEAVRVEAVTGNWLAVRRLARERFLTAF